MISYYGEKWQQLLVVGRTGDDCLSQGELAKIACCAEKWRQLLVAGRNVGAKGSALF